MLIESSSVTTIPTINPISRSIRPILSTIVTLTLIILLLFVFVAPNLSPTGTLLSPLPEGTITETTSVPPAVQPPLIALPETEKASDTAQSQTVASADKLIISFPAGTSEMKIENPKVNDSTYIYLTPISETSRVLYVKSKGAGYFTIAIDSPSTAELLLEYYLITD